MLKKLWRNYRHRFTPWQFVNFKKHAMLQVCRHQYDVIGYVNKGCTKRRKYADHWLSINQAGRLPFKNHTQHHEFLGPTVGYLGEKPWLLFVLRLYIIFSTTEATNNSLLHEYNTPLILMTSFMIYDFGKKKDYCAKFSKYKGWH